MFASVRLWDRASRRLRLQGWNPAIGELILFLGCSLPGMLLSFNSLQEPWTLFRTARASLSLEAGHIVQYVTAAAGYRSEHIGGELLQVALLRATGWPPSAIPLLPIGSLLLSVLYYAAYRFITGSRLAAAAIAVYSATYYPRLFSQYAIQTYAWTNILFLSFLILWLTWIARGGALYQFLALFIFMATFLHYHTTPIWMITLLLLAVIALKCFRLAGNAAHKSASWALPLFALVFYLQFDTVLYGDVLARFASHSADATDATLARNVLSKLVAPILDRSPQGLRPYEIAPTNPRLATWSNLAILLMLVLPVGWWSLRKLQRALSRRAFHLLVENREELLAWSILALSLVHALLYSTYGALSLRLIPLAFPLLIPIVLPHTRLGLKVQRIWLLSIAALAAAGFVSFLSSFRPDTTPTDTGQLGLLVEEGSAILADANTYGAILTAAAQYRKHFDFVWPDSTIYASLVAWSPRPGQRFDLFVADVTGKPVTASHWVFLDPWTRHLAEINENRTLSKVYDSSRLLAYLPAGAHLPAYPLPDFVPKPFDRSLLRDSIRLLITILSLLVLPGAAILLLIWRVFGQVLRDFHVAMSLAIGMSVSTVTVVGYLLNATPPGIRSLVYVVASVSGMILLGVLRLRPQRLPLPRAWRNPAIALLAVLATWSLLATAVAHAREKEHAGFVEFFVARAETRAETKGTVAINVVNGSANDRTFAVLLRDDHSGLGQLGPQQVSAGSVWQIEWAPPGNLVPGDLDIRLVEDGLTRASLLLRGYGLSEQKR